MADLRPGRIRRALLLALLLTSGCTPGPAPDPPAVPLPERWQAAPATPPGGEAPVTGWWRVFGDPLLDRLIAAALPANHDLRRAEARLREARARQGLASAERYPALDAGGAAARGKGSAHGPGQGGVEQDLFEIGFDARWEIDLFGGVRRAAQAAEADAAAALEQRRDLWVSLLAEVARNYLELRGSQRRLVIARDNLETQRNTLALTEARRSAGLDSELAVSQARTQLATTEAQLPALDRIRQQAIHRLGILLGRPPNALRAELEVEAPPPPLPPEIPAGLPSDLLRRRPDVRRVERELAAATLRIGVAEADLFPRFALSGALGRQSLEAGDLALPGSTFWSLGPSMRWPVFDAGRIRANIAVQHARRDELLARYEQTVIGALEEVENALVALADEKASRAALASAVESGRRSLEIAAELYRRGLAGFLDVLLGQRALSQLQDQLAASEQRLATHLVALYKALGGGWEQEEGG